MKNQVVLTIRNAWCHRRAYRLLHMKPRFGSKRKAQWEEERKEFWYVMERLNPEFMNNCPEGHEVVLTCVPIPRTQSQMFYIQYEKVEK